MHTIYVVKAVGEAVDVELCCTKSYSQALSHYNRYVDGTVVGADVLLLVSFQVDDAGNRIEGSMEWVNIRHV